MGACQMQPERTIKRARCLRKAPTRAEEFFWSLVRDRGHEGLRFRRQVPIGQYVVDFACLSARLIIEVDGPHHQTPEAIAYDAQRTGWLESQGFRVRRFTARQTVEDREAVLAAIKTDIASPPSQPFPHQGGRALFRARDQWVRDDEN